MELNSTIVIIGLIILALVVLKLFSKIVLKVIMILLLLIIAGYFLLFWNGGLLDLGNKSFILVELQEKYCDEENTAKCDCIIIPILEDIKNDFPDSKFQELQKNKLKSLQIIYKSLQKNKETINQCLKENNAEDQWKEFIDDLKGISIKKDYQELFETLKNE